MAKTIPLYEAQLKVLRASSMRVEAGIKADRESDAPNSLLQEAGAVDAISGRVPNTSLVDESAASSTKLVSGVLPKELFDSYSGSPLFVHSAVNSTSPVASAMFSAEGVDMYVNSNLLVDNRYLSR
jgi:hypothetical protein